jgi:phospholipid/cholesterol/gamma-HCH transport system substrate-binding protein
MTRRSSRMTRLGRAVAAVLVGTVVLSGCDFDVYELPLPGGTDVGDDAMTVKVQFEDVLDLVPQSSVKVNDVAVGKVTDVRLVGYSAEVTLELRKDVELPDNAIAEIRQTSLLGEKFVSLGPPATGASAEPLGDGDTIALADSGRNPEVEEVLGALSLLLNGGGVAQMKTITQELNKALTGREDSARSVLTQIENFTGSLDDNKADIVDAIESLDRLARATRAQQDDINSALDELPSALTSIDGQRADLVRMLEALNELGDVGVRVVKASKEATIDSITQLQPVLTELANSGDAFVKAFHVFLTYPFVDDVVGRDPQVARNLHMGDYTNLSVTLDIDLTEGLPDPPGIPNIPCIELEQIPPAGPLPPASELCEGAIDAINECLAEPTLENCEGLPDFLLDEICAQLPIPGLCPDGGGGGGGGVPTSLPTIEVPDLPTLDLGGLRGLLRPGTGYESAIDPERGPTYAQLSGAYDPGLVALLVPALVVPEAADDGADDDADDDGRAHR